MDLCQEENEKTSNNCLDFESFRQKYNSWRGHAKHANSYNLRKKYFAMIKINEKLEM